MSGPCLTLDGFCRQRPDLAGHHRLEQFLDLPAEMREGADAAFAHKLRCRRELAYRELAFDRGWPLEKKKRPAPTRAPRSTRPRFARSEDDVFQTISPPVYVAALTGEPVPSTGGSIACPLPDHDDRHPSCRVYPDPGRGWHCFACNRGGSAIDLASHLTGIEPRGEGYLQLRRYVAQRLLGREAA